MFNKKKSYFKKMLEGVEKTIWDLEFKRFKTKKVREEIRELYDNSSAKLAKITTDIEEQSKPGGLKEKSVDEFKRLEDEKILLDRDIKRYQEQMDVLDFELYGMKANNEHPDGLAGVDQQIDALHELGEYVRAYISKEL